MPGSGERPERDAENLAGVSFRGPMLFLGPRNLLVLQAISGRKADSSAAAAASE